MYSLVFFELIGHRLSTTRAATIFSALEVPKLATDTAHWSDEVTSRARLQRSVINVRQDDSDLAALPQ